MTALTSSLVTIQTTEQSAPSVPGWFGEVAVVANYLRYLGVLTAIEERVRFGHYDLIDFAVVLLGYALSGERTLETFYERLPPFAAPFVALFGRERLPHRSAFSRFLASLDQARPIGLPMHPTKPFNHTNGYRAQRFQCPLLFPTKTGQTCEHAQFLKGKGCVKDVNWELGGIQRVILDRDGPLFHAI